MASANALIPLPIGGQTKHMRMPRSSEKDAVALINGLIADLDTSHTALFTPDDDRYYITLDAISGAS